MCHVLIIEDEPMTAMLIQDALEEGGATSFAFAGTEQDAVELAIQHPPAFITSDVHLLDGTGSGAVEAIHATIGQVPVVFITGDPAGCGSVGSQTVVLVKPVSLRQIKAAFEGVAPCETETQPSRAVTNLSSAIERSRELVEESKRILAESTQPRLR